MASPADWDEFDDPFGDWHEDPCEHLSEAEAFLAYGDHNTEGAKSGAGGPLGVAAFGAAGAHHRARRSCRAGSRPSGRGCAVRPGR
ncbi:cobalamin synthesis protein [Mycobacteroides abscessus subsp. abscessus]|nr:cobalamin synthesis protein [Mycobacteroides abscessus subsp. abscessus]